MFTDEYVFPLFDEDYLEDWETFVILGAIFKNIILFSTHCDIKNETIRDNIFQTSYSKNRVKQYKDRL